MGIVRTRKSPEYREYLFKCLWRATSCTYKICGKDYWDAETRLKRLLMKSEGGIHCLEIQYKGTGRVLPSFTRDS